MTFLGASWLWASLLVGCIRLAAIARNAAQVTTSCTRRFGSRAFVYFGICFGFFFMQLVIATLLDRARWRTYPKLFLLAPFYTSTSGRSR